MLQFTRLERLSEAFYSSMLAFFFFKKSCFTFGSKRTLWWVLLHIDLNPFALLFADSSRNQRNASTTMGRREKKYDENDVAINQSPLSRKLHKSSRRWVKYFFARRKTIDSIKDVFYGARWSSFNIRPSIWFTTRNLVSVHWLIRLRIRENRLLRSE